MNDRSRPESDLASLEGLATFGRGGGVATTGGFAATLEAKLGPNRQRMGGRAGITTGRPRR